MRRAKIVVTLGPATSDAAVLEKLLELGVDVVRVNFSHGTHEEHARTFDRIRTASRRLGRAVAVLQDLQGPKIRTGPLAAGRPGVRLDPGAEIAITTEQGVAGDARLVSTTYPHLAEDVRPGDRILLDDGLMELRVLATDGVRVRAEVVEGGVLGEHKGMNLPGVALRAEALSEKDRDDLAFGISHGVDLVAISFVRSPADIGLCRSEMERAGRVVPVVAKIERPEAVARLDAIAAAADGIMVARGDLGVEIAPERVPLVQKDICRKANAAGKPVIIATQTLSSMIDHPRPTRAEATDVANAIWDGADAVMLSGETAVGSYPLAAVQMLDRIVSEAETAVPPGAGSRAAALAGADGGIALVTAEAACQAASASHAVAICCFTMSGETARLVARFRPQAPIVAFSPDQAVRRQLALTWGVLPEVMESLESADRVAEKASRALVEDGLAAPGDRIVLVHGSPLGNHGQTNSLRIHEIAGR